MAYFVYTAAFASSSVFMLHVFIHMYITFNILLTLFLFINNVFNLTLTELPCINMIKNNKKLGSKTSMFKVGKYTSVCSNHFDYGRPTDVSPRP